MEDRTVELIIISAQDLKRVKNFGHQTCYVVAFIYPEHHKATKVDSVGGVNPVWNEKLTLTCDESLMHRGGACITVEIYSQGSFSTKLVGTVTIPLLDVFDEAKDEPKRMAFQVRRPSGKAKGILNLSVKLGEKRRVGRDKKQSYPYVQPQGAAPVDYPPQSHKQGQDWSQPKPTATYSPSKASVSNSPTTFGTSSLTYGAGVYPPPKGESSSSGTYSSGNSSAAYPPPKESGNPKMDEPVLAYPATGYPVGGYPPQQYAPQYSSQQYYPPPHASAPYNYQQAYYSRPPRRSGGSGLGMGLLGGALGGLLLGDLIGDIGGC